MFLSTVLGTAVCPEAQEERRVVRNGDFHPTPHFYAFGLMRTESLVYNRIIMQFPCDGIYIYGGDVWQAAELLWGQEQTSAPPAFAPGAQPWPPVLLDPSTLSFSSASPSSAEYPLPL